MKIPTRPPKLHEFNDLASKSAQETLVRTLTLAGLRLSPTNRGRYLPWDELRHKPAPNGLSPEDHWLAVRFARRAASRSLPFADVKGNPFTLAHVPALAELLHEVDRDAAGAIDASPGVANTESRDRYLMTSLFEEAITSSQLEGASTTRERARDMLREGRAPKDHSERMIVNTYRAMEWLRTQGESELTPAIVFRLHELVTEGTLDDPADAGRFREDADEIVVSDDMGQVLHRPPKADELPQRLADLCHFANASAQGEDFLHPVLRSILLHFKLAYDHPFVDGNGRVARALFYWSMARHGYWRCEFVSISRILRRARAAYLRSYLYCETDDNDVTYFVFDQLRVLRRGIRDLHDYLARKAGELRDTKRVLAAHWKTKVVLNQRQLALLGHALRHPQAAYTAQSHRRSHAVAYDTARRDLLELVEEGLLMMHKEGKKFVFTPAGELGRRVR